MPARKGQTVILSDGQVGIVTDVGDDGAYSGFVIGGTPFAVDAPPPAEPEPTPPAEPELVDESEPIDLFGQDENHDENKDGNQ